MKMILFYNEQAVDADGSGRDDYDFGSNDNRMHELRRLQQQQQQQQQKENYYREYWRSRRRRVGGKNIFNGTGNISFRDSSYLLAMITFAAVLLISGGDFVLGQFNEPPGQRREQTFRVLEYEISNINQHYPDELRYYCTFRGKWSKERHPNDFPNSPSFSAPVIVSHSKGYRMWTGTEAVTAGVEYLAEEGYPTVMYNEFDNAGFETLQMIVGERMFNTTDTQHLPPVNVSYTHPWLSSMSKIVPSPDWFVGFSDLRTISYDTETYYNRIVLQSYVWDSGTDDGQSYLAFDRDLDPQEPCMRFCVPKNIGAGGSGTEDTNVNHHPNGNSRKCPDHEKGRRAIPSKTLPFVDYTLTYIPYPAEYECVLRVGDGEVYAGNAFNESQIHPPKYVARPDDDFVDGISPYDQPRYDEHMAEFYGDDDDFVPQKSKTNFNPHWLWLILLITILLSCMCCFGVYILLMSGKRRRKADPLPPPEEDEYDPESEYDGPNLFDNRRDFDDDYDEDGEATGLDYDKKGNPIDIMKSTKERMGLIPQQSKKQQKGQQELGDGTEGFQDEFDGTAPYSDIPPETSTDPFDEGDGYDDEDYHDDDVAAAVNDPYDFDEGNHYSYRDDDAIDSERATMVDDVFDSERATMDDDDSGNDAGTSDSKPTSLSALEDLGTSIQDEVDRFA